MVQVSWDESCLRLVREDGDIDMCTGLELLINGGGSIGHLCLGIVLVSEDGAIDLRELNN